MGGWTWVGLPAQFFHLAGSGRLVRWHCRSDSSVLEYRFKLSGSDATLGYAMEGVIPKGSEHGLDYRLSSLCPAGSGWLWAGFSGNGSRVGLPTQCSSCGSACEAMGSVEHGHFSTTWSLVSTPRTILFTTWALVFRTRTF
ncbi:hypothetical protein BJ165DRAFT_766353 [Panaeolus papilionaceus]|nr:hypothetical protein BJ165DRAFT_766353 [Panaeolus papilionaceus]